MKNQLSDQPSSVLFIPHGGGPLPLLSDKKHQDLINFLRKIRSKLVKPSVILVISAHWEEDKVTITSSKNPALIYDYSGFPDEAYQVKYPASGDPVLANKIYKLLRDNGIEAKLDESRGFDHGLFVPLKIMFPDADIPCVQLSLVKNLDPDMHIKIGRSLADLRNEKILVIGSGFSFHNLRSFFSHSAGEPDMKNEAFQQWLIDTCTNEELSENDRKTRLIAWNQAPSARFCHPREEHLLPLHVCYGMTNSAAELVFEGKVIGKKVCAFLW